MTEPIEIPIKVFRGGLISSDVKEVTNDSGLPTKIEYGNTSQGLFGDSDVTKDHSGRLLVKLFPGSSTRIRFEYDTKTDTLNLIDLDKPMRAAYRFFTYTSPKMTYTRNNAMVFIYKRRNGLSVVDDSITNAYKTIDSIMESQSTTKIDKVYQSTVQLCQNYILDLNFPDKDKAKIAEKLRQGEREAYKGDLNKANIVAVDNKLEINKLKYRADFHQAAPESLKIKDVEINPKGIVELYGSTISTTLLNTVVFPPNSENSKQLYADSGNIASVSSAAKYKRRLERAADYDVLELKAYKIVLYNDTTQKTVSTMEKLPSVVYFTDGEEQKYLNEGGTLLSANDLMKKISGSQITTVQQVDERVATDEFSGKFGIKSSKKTYDSTKLKYKQFDLFMKHLYERPGQDRKFTQNNNTSVFTNYRLFAESQWSTEALQQLMYRFAFFLMLTNESPEDSSIKVEQESAIQFNTAQRKVREGAIIHSLNASYDQVVTYVLSGYERPPPFRILARNDDVLGANFVGAAERKRNTIVFKEIKVGRSKYQVIDPPQLGSLQCFNSAINFAFPDLMSKVPKTNNRNDIVNFCKTYGISISTTDNDLSELISSDFIISDKLSEKSIVARFAKMRFEEIQSIDPKVNKYARLSTVGGRKVVVYPTDFSRPNLLLHDNHVYIVARMAKTDNRCHRCANHFDDEILVLHRGHYFCTKCLKHTDEIKQKVSTCIGVVDTETNPESHDGGITIKQQITDINMTISKYFEPMAPVANSVVKEFCDATGDEVDFKTMKTTLTFMRSYERLKSYLSRDASVIIEELNEMKNGEYVIPETEAYKILFEKFKLQNYDYKSCVEFFEQLKEFSDKKEFYSLYGHNAAKFDSILIAAEAMRSDDFDIEKFLPVGNSILTFGIHNHNFIDSYKFLNQDLLTICKDNRLGRFSKIETVEGVDKNGKPKIYKVKELFNLQPWYPNAEAFYNKLKELRVYDSFMKYALLDTISLILIMILFTEAALKIMISTLESCEWYRDEPERYVFCNAIEFTNKQLAQAYCFNKIFNISAITLGQLSMSTTLNCDRFVESKYYSDFIGYGLRKTGKTQQYCKIVLTEYNKKYEPISEFEATKVECKVGYYLQRCVKPIELVKTETEAGEVEVSISEHQIIENRNKLGGVSWVNKKYCGKVITKGGKTFLKYRDIKSLYPTVILGKLYYEETHPDHPFKNDLADALGDVGYFPIYRDESSITKTKGKQIIDLINGTVIPIDQVEYCKSGNQFFTKPVQLSKKSCYVCYLDFIIKTNKSMLNVIASRSSETLDWDFPNLMSANYRRSLTEEQFQQIKNIYGDFKIEEYIVVDEIKVSELQRYNFIFQIAADEYAVIYHIKTDRCFLFDCMLVCAQQKEKHDLWKESKDKRYNASYRNALKAYMNIPTGKVNQGCHRVRKVILDDSADIFATNNYDSAVYANGRIVVSDHKLEGTFGYIGGRIYSLSKKLLFYYLAKDGWDTIVKIETDGWLSVNPTLLDGEMFVNDQYDGSLMGQLEIKDKYCCLAVGKKCSIIYSDPEEFEVTFRGLSKTDIANYGEADIKIRGEKVIEELGGTYKYGCVKIFNEILRNKIASVPVKLFKRNLFNAKSNISVHVGTKHFVFDF